MPRPTKYRMVEELPKEEYFVPANVPKCSLDEIVLKVEELEAMRLKDVEELHQEACAERMNVSRQTFQNIIDSARKKVAIALTEGKAIRIGGGHFVTKHCKFRCFDCNNEYDINVDYDKTKCPVCGSENVMCSKKADRCKKWCRCEEKD